MKPLILLPLVAMTSLSICAVADESSPLQISGFVRVVAGYLDTDQAEFDGYSDKISFDQKSLFGLQADYHVSDSISLSGQVVAHTDDNRESGIEWLYLNYTPTADWQVKLGRLRTPYLKYSEVIDVGFAYPWLSAPRELYGSYTFFPRYDGVNARYSFNLDEVYFSVEGYYGDFKDDIVANGESFNVDVSGMYGGIIEAKYAGFGLRAASFISGDVNASVEGMDQLLGALNQAGFPDIADYFRLKGSVDSYVMGATYDSLDWFASAERIKVIPSLTLLSGIDNYYLTVGRYIGDYQLMVTFARAKQELNTLENTIPVGLDPQLDQLYYGVEQLRARFPTDDLSSIKVTGRWDYSPNLAFKAEVSFLNGEKGKTSFFDVDEDANDFDRKATLYLVGMEWVF